MSEYNKLTQRLLAEGYTADNYPDYVKIGGENFGKGDPLDNFYGGFEYTRECREKMVASVAVKSDVARQRQLDECPREYAGAEGCGFCTNSAICGKQMSRMITKDPSGKSGMTSMPNSTDSLRNTSAERKVTTVSGMPIITIGRKHGSRYTIRCSVRGFATISGRLAS